jgi:hypothetical protein
MWISHLGRLLIWFIKLYFQAIRLDESLVHLDVWLFCLIGPQRGERVKFSSKFICSPRVPESCIQMSTTNALC